MKQILHSYQLRLTNLSQGNRALRLMKLSKRQDIDLKSLGGLEDHSAEDMLQRLIQGKNVSLLRKLDPRFAPVNVADRRLNRIYRQARLLFEETGSYDLFLGYPFVEGQFIDGTYTRCPVLLFPIELKRDLKGKPRWELIFQKDEPILFNKTFFLAYEQFQQVRLKSEFWEEEFEPGKDWLEWLNELYQKIKEYELEVNFNPRLFDRQLEPFEDLNKIDLKRFRPGVLSFRSQAVLGIFPQSDSALLQDYEALSREPDRFPLQQWLEGTARPTHSPTKVPVYKEEERFFVTDLDQSQEAALLAVKGGQSLVIHGPPGTGKSQVIVNLMADAMAHGKKVLLVSQKRAALDVVHQRLKGLALGQFAVLVHDYRHDRKPIFQQLKHQIDRLEAFQKDLQDLSLTKLDHDFKLFSRQLDQYARKYEELHQALIESRRCGYRAHELYQRLAQGFQPWPELKEVAPQLTQEQWVYLSRKLERLLNYRDLLDESHAWHQRLSFHRWQASDLSRLSDLLPSWKAMVLDWHQAYQTLAPKLSSRLLDSQLNQERIEAFERADRSLQKHQLREGMEQLNLEGLSGEKALEQLQQWEKLIQQLANRSLLHDGHWKYLADLERHQEAYESWVKKPLRWLTLPFHQARWFFRKLAKTEGLNWEPSTFTQLSADLAPMRSLRRRYGKFHDHAFWADFPLLENQANKEAWLEHKKEAAKAYADIRGLSFFKKIKPRFEKGKFLQKRWQESLRWIDQLKQFNQSRQHPAHPWQGWLHPQQIAHFEAVVKEKNIPDSFHQYYQDLEESLKQDFFDLRDLDKLIHSLTPEESKAVRGLADRWIESGSTQDFIDQVEKSLLLYWLEECEAQSPILQEVSSRAWAGELKQFEEILADRQKLVATLVQHRLKERMAEIVRYNRLKNPITYREIHHQVSKKRRLWSMRKLIAQTWNQGLDRLAPCWLASPESAAALFPLEADFFDLVIFDEASQCLVERALPIALRAKQCVVAGDAQQLRPFDLYRVRYEDSEEDFVENEKALEVESLLDLAQLSLPEVKLHWHYRSENQALINYSNHAFYEGRLEFLPYARPDRSYHPALEWVSVNGTWENNQNLIEAQAVVSAIEKLTALQPAPTLGVVTFNYRQQQLISDLIDQRLEWLAQHHEAGYAQLWAALNRKAADEWQGVFVKNIENVQGDERELILFSLGYGPDPSGKLSMNFGLLNQEGGENRLNVAITRAKKKVLVFSSFQPHQLEVAQSVHAGPKHFKNYLSYVQAYSHGETQLLEQSGFSTASINPEVSKDTFLADAVSQRLEQRGLFIERNLGASGYRLDLAIKLKAEDSHYALGIEVEGPAYFQGKSAKEREIYRPRTLKRRGWKVYRVWARNWWRNPEKEIGNIMKLLEKK